NGAGHGALEEAVERVADLDDRRGVGGGLGFGVRPQQGRLGNLPHFRKRVAVAAGDRLAVNAGDGAAGLDEGGGVGAGFVEGVPGGGRSAPTLPSPRWGRGIDDLVDGIVGGAGFGDRVVSGDGVASFGDRRAGDCGFGEAEGLKRGRLSYGAGFYERGGV